MSCASCRPTYSQSGAHHQEYFCSRAASFVASGCFDAKPREVFEGDSNMTTCNKTTTIKVACPACGGDKVWKSGVQRGQQRYQCAACKVRFRHGMEMGKRMTAEQVGTAIRLYYSGMSYKQIAESMADTYNIPEPSKATVYEWVRDYTDRAVQRMKHHKANVGDAWVADEMMVDVGGEKM